MRQELFQDVIDAVNAGYTSILFLEELDEQQLVTLNQTLEAQGVVIDEIILYALGSNIIEFIRPIIPNLNKIYVNDVIEQEAAPVMQDFFPENAPGRAKLFYDNLLINTNHISTSGIKLLLKALSQGYVYFIAICISRGMSFEETELLKDISNNGFILPFLELDFCRNTAQLAMVESILKTKIQYKSLSFVISEASQEWENFLSKIEFNDNVQKLFLRFENDNFDNFDFFTKNNIENLTNKLNNIYDLVLWDRGSLSQEGCLYPLFKHLKSDNNKIKNLSLSGFSAEKSLFSKLSVNHLYELELYDYSDSRLHDQLLPQISSSNCRLEKLQISNFAQRDNFLLNNSIQFYQELVSGPIYLKHFNYSSLDENF
ncbi:MAG: hypothetical protein K0R02_1164, partial [Rickettsiaceae bacterium]|nr:hypothetical protein [Rickettsiaceae bacterium]